MESSDDDGKLFPSTYFSSARRRFDSGDSSTNAGSPSGDIVVSGEGPKVGGLSVEECLKTTVQTNVSDSLASPVCRAADNVVFQTDTGQRAVHMPADTECIVVKREAISTELKEETGRVDLCQVSAESDTPSVVKVASGLEISQTVVATEMVVFDEGSVEDDVIMEAETPQDDEDEPIVVDDPLPGDTPVKVVQDSVFSVEQDVIIQEKVLSPDRGKKTGSDDVKVKGQTSEPPSSSTAQPVQQGDVFAIATDMIECAEVTVRTSLQQRNILGKIGCPFLSKIQARRCRRGLKVRLCGSSFFQKIIKLNKCLMIGPEP